MHRKGFSTAPLWLFVSAGPVLLDHLGSGFEDPKELIGSWGCTHRDSQGDQAQDGHSSGAARLYQGSEAVGSYNSPPHPPREMWRSLSAYHPSPGHMGLLISHDHGLLSCVLCIPALPQHHITSAPGPPFFTTPYCSTGQKCPTAIHGWELLPR